MRSGFTSSSGECGFKTGRCKRHDIALTRIAEFKTHRTPALHRAFDATIPLIPSATKKHSRDAAHRDFRARHRAGEITFIKFFPKEHRLSKPRDRHERAANARRSSHSKSRVASGQRQAYHRNATNQERRASYIYQCRYTLPKPKTAYCDPSHEPTFGGNHPMMPCAFPKPSSRKS